VNKLSGGNTDIISTLANSNDEVAEDVSSDIIVETLEYIRVNGLRIGNRWIIKEEGEQGDVNAPLVFRDLHAKDSKYTMQSNFKDL